MNNDLNECMVPLDEFYIIRYNGQLVKLSSGKFSWDSESAAVTALARQINKKAFFMYVQRFADVSNQMVHEHRIVNEKFHNGKTYGLFDGRFISARSPIELVRELWKNGIISIDKVT